MADISPTAVWPTTVDDREILVYIFKIVQCKSRDGHLLGEGVVAVWQALTIQHEVHPSSRADNKGIGALDLMLGGVNLFVRSCVSLSYTSRAQQMRRRRG